jgi:hypothetical protein
MNTDELRTELDAIAGPPPAPTRAARDAVDRRVRRLRRRTGLVTGGLAVIVGVVLAAGALDATSGSGGPPDVVVSPASDSCRRLPRAVPGRVVPPEVRRWADGARVVGHDSLWSVRRLLDGAAVREASVERLKIGWFVVPPGPDAAAPVVSAREVGGPGRAIGSANLATDANGTWFASTIELPASGSCWEITARHGDDVIRFRRSVGGSDSG